MLPKYKKICLLVGAVVGISIPALSYSASPTLEDLINLPEQKAPAKTDVGEMRAAMVAEAATGVGVRGGLASRSAEINKWLNENGKPLDGVYVFSSLVISDKLSGGTSGYMVLPPVILESKSIYGIEADNVLRLADAEYEISQPARFISVIPSWRDYLFMSVPSGDDTPHASLMPKTDSEREIWKRKVQDGWTEGVRQADAILGDNLARLKRDFGGMVFYRKLLAQGKVSKPYVAKSDLGVTGDGKHLNINDQVLRITAASMLDADANKWASPVTVKDVVQLTPEAVGNDAAVEDADAGASGLKMDRTIPKVQSAPEQEIQKPAKKKKAVRKATSQDLKLKSSQKLDLPSEAPLTALPPDQSFAEKIKGLFR